MIETRAHKEGKSEELKQVCEFLIDGLRKEHCERKHRKSFWLTAILLVGLVITLTSFLYVQLEPFATYIWIPGILMMIGGAGTCAAFALGRSVELQVTEFHEVSGEYYNRFIEKARHYSDLVILVEGQEYLTIKDAKTGLQRLRRRVLIETQNDKNGSSPAAKTLLEEQRVAFQVISLKNCSNSPSTYASGV